MGRLEGARPASSPLPDLSKRETMPPKTKKTAALLLALMPPDLSGCLGGSQDTSTVITPDPGSDTRLANELFLENGDPAFGAFVEFYPRAYLPGIDKAGVYSTQTNAGGGYSIDSLVPGVYDIVAY